MSVLTQVDNIAPTAPYNLISTATNTNSVDLSWTGSTDNVGIFKYDILKNGVKVLSIPNTSTTATVYNLTVGQVYKFTVKARDMTGNLSAESNTVIVSPVSAGLQYQYYELATAPSVLPTFTSLTPIEVGTSPNVDLSVRNRDTNIAFYWSGMINIPVAGNYTFGTTSDDGSRLYIGSYNDANIVVANDGAHGNTSKEGTKNFPAPGLYPIIITYFNAGGGFSMSVYWKNTASGQVAQVAIPNSAFTPNAVPIGGVAPLPPNNLTATAISYDKINLAWTDASNNETGFKIYRSTVNTGPFVPVATVGANTTTYQDQRLTGATTYYYRVTSYGEFGESILSTQIPRGLSYSYYEAGNMTSLSQITNMVPIETGYSNFFDVALRNRDQNMPSGGLVKSISRQQLHTRSTHRLTTEAH